MLQNLVDSILEAHGGLNRWSQLKRVNVTIVSGGRLFNLINQPQDASPRYLEVSLHEQRLAMTPYGGPEKKTNFTPNRIAIEKVSGEVLSERRGSIEELHNHMKADGWDPLDRAYFNGYANWTYLTTPFFLAWPGIEVDEIAPWQHENEIWKGIQITFPKSIATHCLKQDFYFDKNYLLCRHDYFIDVAGEFNAAQYLSDYIDVDGIKLPTKRRAYIKQADGGPSLDDLMVHIDYSDIKFS